MDGEESIHTHTRPQIFTRTSSVVLRDIIEQILMYEDGSRAFASLTQWESKRIKAKEKKTNIQQLRTKLYYTDTE